MDLEEINHQRKNKTAYEKPIFIPPTKVPIVRTKQPKKASQIMFLKFWKNTKYQNNIPLHNPSLEFKK